MRHLEPGRALFRNPDHRLSRRLRKDIRRHDEGVEDRRPDLARQDHRRRAVRLPDRQLRDLGHQRHLPRRPARRRREGRRRRDHRRPVPLQLPDRAAAAHPAHPSVGDAAAGPRHGPRQPDPVADGDRGDARPEGARARAAGVGSARRQQRHRGAELQGPERPVRPAAVRPLPRRARAVGGRLRARASRRPRARPARQLARRRDAGPDRRPARRSTATAPSGAPPPISSCRRPPPARSRRRATRSSRLLQRAQGDFPLARVPGRQRRRGHPRDPREDRRGVGRGRPQAL